jgi:p-aminobenzoyl-glutamate transporter AbgT
MCDPQLLLQALFLGCKMPSPHITFVIFELILMLISLTGLFSCMDCSAVAAASAATHSRARSASVEGNDAKTSR